MDIEDTCAQYGSIEIMATIGMTIFQFRYIKFSVDADIFVKCNIVFW